MTDPFDVFLTLSIDFNGKRAQRRVRLGPGRSHQPMSAPPVPFLDTMDTAAVKLKEREYSRETIAQAAENLAAQLSNELEDAFGWHGEDREAAARKRLR